MKQLAVISGKGGTGKTTLVAAFAGLAEQPVLADCDVDAADLHLILAPEIKQTHSFDGGLVASIDLNKCVDCGVCRELCRFDAIDENYVIDSFACEGCGVCHDRCPADAVTLTQEIAGDWFESETRVGPMVHAALGIAQENSGKLVAQVRTRARELAEQQSRNLIIVDGSPGIGCPVISSITGVDLVLVCTEPTPSGIHDLDRVLDLAEHFNAAAAVCVNKADLSPALTEQIEQRTNERGATFVGTVPYDTAAVKAQLVGRSVVENGDGELAGAVRRIWQAVENLLQKEA